PGPVVVPPGRPALDARLRRGLRHTRRKAAMPCRGTEPGQRAHPPHRRLATATHRWFPAEIHPDPGVVIHSQRAAASAVSSGRVLNAMAASGAALRTALMTFSNNGRAFGGSLRPAPITTQS